MTTSVEFCYDSPPGRVVFGAGMASTHIAREVASLGGRRVMLIAGPGEAHLADRLAAGIEDRIAVRFNDVRPHVPIEVADKAVALAHRQSIDLLLSIGGGSTTGTAKIVALSDGLPIVCVPTTYAGSEVTPVWGRTEAGVKRTGVSERVRPQVVVYDPDLVKTLPRDLTVVSALNAMAHCIEALWTPKSNPITSMTALEGVRALAAGLRLTGDESEKTTAATQLLYGAYLAGTAFAVAGSGLHHKICHALGGGFDLPHAETHAVVLPHVLAFNAVAPSMAGQMSRLADALGALDPVEGMADLYARAEPPRSLADIGLPGTDLSDAVRLVTAKLPISNPRPVDEHSITAILTSAHGALD
ncbi:maleylacetate reductase [Mycolicibacterium sp. A43C]